MIANVIIGALLSLVGAIITTYNLAQGFGENWPWALMGFAVLVAGMILLYAAFRPVIL